MVIDFHTHTFPDTLAATALKKMQSNCHTAVFTDGTVNALNLSMKQAGIDYSVVLPVATNPLKVSSINDISLGLAGKEGLIYFGCIHPETENWYEELGRIANAGLKGIKIHPVFQGVDIDDIRFLRILDRAGQLGLTVVMHAGDDIGFPGVVRCSPAMTLNALRQVGKITLVMAHMGGWRNWDQVEELLTGTNVYIDTAYSLGTLVPLDDRHYSSEQLRLLDEEKFCKLVRLFGSRKVLFGTDSPWADQRQSKDEILALPLSEEEKADVLGGNALTLLRL